VTSADTADVCAQYQATNTFYWKTDPNDSDAGFLYLQTGTSGTSDSKSITINVSTTSWLDDATTAHTDFVPIPVAIAVNDNNSGNVGVGTTNPQARLDVTSGSGVKIAQWGYSADRTNYNLNLTPVDEGSASVRWDLVQHNLTDYPIMSFRLGNVGIGTTNPGAKLEVKGNLKVSGPGSSITFADQSVQSTAWTGTLCGGDYAESVDVTGPRSRYEPGDVMVVDPDNDSFAKSAQPYSTTVAGIYSTKPGVIGRKSTDPARTQSEVPMAMIGIVPTKVSAENGPIRRGDLLVTSSTLGHAMKGTDRSRMLGAVVGKALGTLDASTGMIDVLVTLQ
jgi:hypothetical protein